MNEVPLSEQDNLAAFSAVEATSQPTPGQQLAYAREARGWTVQEVANQLNLASRQIVALEADNLGALPGTAIARGFIRSYAKLLHIDSAPLLAMLTAEHNVPSALAAPSNTLSASFPDNRVRSVGQASSPVKSVGWFLTGLAFLILLILGGQKMEWIPPLPASISGLLDEQLEFLRPPAATMAGTSDENPLAGETATDIMPAAIPDVVPDAPVTPPVAGSAPLVTPAPAAVAPAATPANGNRLVLTMRQDSWIEIKRADGTVQFSRVAKAGSSETVDITGPVDLTIGNAAGVDATWRGAPLSLAGSASNVARLNLK